MTNCVEKENGDQNSFWRLFSPFCYRKGLQSCYSCTLYILQMSAFILYKTLSSNLEHLKAQLIKKQRLFHFHGRFLLSLSLSLASRQLLNVMERFLLIFHFVTFTSLRPRNSITITSFVAVLVETERLSPALYRHYV